MTGLRIMKARSGFREEDGLGGLMSVEAIPADTVVWVNLEAPSSDELETLATKLRLHPMTIEEIEHEDDRPRIRQYGDVLSIIFFAVRIPSGANGEVEFDPIRVLAGRRFLVTVNDRPLPELEEAYDRWRDGAAHLPADAGAPMYCVLDTLVDGYFPVIDRIADDVDEVEDTVIADFQSAALPSIFALKKSMLRFRRIASAARDVVNTVQRHDGILDEALDFYLQDVYDHIVRITDSVDTYRDLLGNAMDTYLSAVSNRLAESSNRLNETMQTLTSWSIVIGCGAVITGFYGMNVDGLPLAHTRFGLASVLLLMFGLAAVLLALFRRKRWV